MVYRLVQLVCALHISGLLQTLYDLVEPVRATIVHVHGRLYGCMVGRVAPLMPILYMKMRFCYI